MKKVSVIGAGFAGMTVSLRLAQAGFQVDLYERSDRLGGLLGTDNTEFGIAEKAANALIRTDMADALFTELGLTPSLPLESSKKRFFFREHPRSWPLTFVESVTTLFKVVPKLLFAKKKLKPQRNQTLQTWGEAHLGSSATRFLLGPAMQGIYANDISGLSSALILGPLFGNRKRSKYKGLLTSSSGMQGLVDKLEQKIREAGVNIHLNSEVNLNDLTGPVVVATSASGAAALTREVHPRLSAVLAKIKMSSLMSVTVFFDKAQAQFKGFGCLIPRGYGLKTLGILMNSYIFEKRDKTYNETWIMGGHDQEDLLNLSDAELLNLIRAEREKVLGLQDQILGYKINRWPLGLPYYDLNLEGALADLRDANLPKNLYLHGNYLGGIGLSKILERSQMLAEIIRKKHG
ncbi:protoporphyrinogen/coproporphyrinogen oxidase [Bdellovibrio reynosensis]|uniref:FAD-dependent oxidoreductase n=1 Tax=Bdellovibrio reynosensis TaxID=2835041 RepID=A0ABY4C7C4_9BACT|nr:FAD-dependent oxidoreductase [Bdellovibrio reynosensis]UOF00810.1 FAD-dependent oxidoreductase [Bdellovibrio reynosensis]